MKETARKKLSEKLRNRLKLPLGELLSEEELHRKISGRKGMLITVGDICTLSLLRKRTMPDFCFVDLKYERKNLGPEERKAILGFDADEIRVKNSAGTVSNEVLELCRNLFSEKRKQRCTRIVVDGEEDLCAIPAMMFAPLGSLIIYGQPKEGVVLIEMNEGKRKLAEKIYGEFE